MSRLNTDNPDQLPITAAVYGRRGFKPVKKGRKPRGHSFPSVAEAFEEAWARWAAKKKAQNA